MHVGANVLAGVSTTSGLNASNMIARSASHATETGRSVVVVPRKNTDLSHEKAESDVATADRGAPVRDVLTERPLKNCREPRHEVGPLRGRCLVPLRREAADQLPSLPS